MNKQIDTLIDDLSAEASKNARLPNPIALLSRAGAILLLYVAIVLFFLGLRDDILLQLARPFYGLEVVLLLITAFISLLAAIHLSYPDRYQQPQAEHWPFVPVVLLVLAIAVQYLLPADARMVAPPQTGGHSMECALCIGSVAVIPTALLFLLLRKGATVYPLRAGMWIVLAAASIGCFALRLSEANDMLNHVVFWHYLPTLAFAALGAGLGKFLLRW